MSKTKVTLEMPIDAMKRFRDAVTDGDPNTTKALQGLGILEIHFPKPDLGVEVVKIPQKEGES